MSAARHQKENPYFGYNCPMKRSESSGRHRGRMIGNIFAFWAIYWKNNLEIQFNLLNVPTWRHPKIW